LREHHTSSGGAAKAPPLANRIAAGKPAEEGCLFVTMALTSELATNDGGTIFEILSERSD